MSFTADCKTELAAIENSPCCKKAQSYAMLLFGKKFSDAEISLLTENETVASAYTNAVHELSGTDITPEITTAGNRKITLKNTTAIAAVMDSLNITDVNKRRVNFDILVGQCCFAAFLRGAFLVCGSVTDPEKEYHLEFTASTKELSDDLEKLFAHFGLYPKTTTRSGSHIVYFKNSSDIEDTLAIIGAQENSLRMMGAKMYKDIRNTVNRKVNFENANFAKTIAAAAKQYDAIDYIKKHSAFDGLPDELREIAQIRYENTDLSNSEIAKMLSEPITVSGINHRFNRLIKIAEQLKEKGK